MCALPAQGYWQASFDMITLFGSGNTLVGKTQAVFDTGTTMIIGDPSNIALLYEGLAEFGAQSEPGLGDGWYSSTWASSAADQTPHDV